MTRVSDRLFTPRFFVMCGFSFTVFLSAFQLLPTAPYHVIDLGGSTFAAGMFLGVLTYASAFSAPLTGAIADRVGQRRVLIICSLALVGFSVGAFYAPLTSTATKWFTERRGLAVAVVSSGIGAGILMISPLARALTTAWDWRVAMLVLGDIAWLVIIPTALLIRDDAPVTARAAGRPEPAYSSAQVLRAPQFWAIALTHFACCAAHSGPIFHMVTHATDQGVPAMAAAAALGVSGLSSIAGRIGGGMIADRLGVKRTLIGGLLLQAAIIAAYLLAREAWTFYALAVVFGTAYGGVMPLYALVTREYFGEKVMGTAYGAVFLVSSLGMGLGSLAGGVIYDRLGAYAWLYLGSALAAFMAVLLAFTFRRPSGVHVRFEVPAAAR